MKDELQEHKASDKIKWVFTLIAFLIIAFFLAGICLHLFLVENQKLLGEFPDGDEGDQERNESAIATSLSTVISYDDEISTQASGITQYEYLMTLKRADETIAYAYCLSPQSYPNHLYVGSNRSDEEAHVDYALSNWAVWCLVSGLGEYRTFFMFDLEPTIPAFKGLTISGMTFWYINPSTGNKVTVRSSAGRYNAYMRLNEEYAYVYLENVKFAQNGDVDFHFSYEFLTYPFPDDPVKEGYTFNGWYEGADEGNHEACNEFAEGRSIFEDTQLHAHFTINTYTVTFDSGGGTSVSSQTVDWNTTANLPSVERKGYTFTGWFLEDGTEYVDQPIKEDATLTAQWERIMCTVTFFVDGEVYETKIIEYGSAFTEVVTEANTLSLRVLSITSDNAQAVIDGIVTDDNVKVTAERMSDFDKAINTAKQNKWTILGGVVGGIAFIAVIAVVCSKVKRKR